MAKLSKQSASKNGAKAYERFFNLSNDMLCIAGLDGYFKLLNPSFERVLGYCEDELLSKPFSEFVHPEDREADLVELEKLRAGMPVVYCEKRYLCKDGSYKWLAWTAFTDIEKGLIYAAARDIDELSKLKDEISSLKNQFLAGELKHKAAFSSIVTKNKKMLAIFQYIEAIARTGNPVLIIGETGVGKELLAMAVHEASELKGAYIAVNVGGLDDTMFSDTLFGHKKGAYTGADRARDGLIVQAAGGTLLLDEIGDLNEASQVKLLRLLEDKMYYPLGSDTQEISNARIIACSNRDIQNRASEGNFRKDLYYRLCTHHIHIPPLRERLEDIPLLLDCLLEEGAKLQNKKKPAPPRELYTLLSNYDFPGNVRELKAMVFDAVARHETGILSMDGFRRFIKRKGPFSKTTIPDQGAATMLDVFGHFPAIKEVEDHLISDALKRSSGNQGIAASLLGLTRQALNNRIKRKTRRS